MTPLDPAKGGEDSEVVASLFPSRCSPRVIHQGLALASGRRDAQAPTTSPPSHPTITKKEIASFRQETPNGTKRDEAEGTTINPSDLIMRTDARGQSNGHPIKMRASHSASCHCLPLCAMQVRVPVPVRIPDQRRKAGQNAKRANQTTRDGFFPSFPFLLNPGV